MTPGQINLKEIGPEEMGFGQMNPIKINSLRNEFLHTVFKITEPHSVSK